MMMLKKVMHAKREGKSQVKANAFGELLPTHSDLADDGLFASGHFRR